MPDVAPRTVLCAVLALAACQAPDAVAPPGHDARGPVVETALTGAVAMVDSGPQASFTLPGGEVLTIERSVSDAASLFEPEDLSHPRLVALRPLVEAIYRDYGWPRTSVGKVRALRDWVARTAVIGMNGFHPDRSTANRGVLPRGRDWRDVNRVANTRPKVAADAAFWWNIGSDGTAMLRALIGDYDPTYDRWIGNGMMEPVGGSQFRIRNVTTHRYSLCTFQAVMVVSLWAAAGFQGSLVQSIDHDGAAVFIPELGRWIWEDPTYNEEYVMDGGAPLAVTRLLTLSARDSLHAVRSRRIAGPRWDPETYIDPAVSGCCSYTALTPNGFSIVAQQVRSRQAGVAGWNTATYYLTSQRAGGFVPLGALPGARRDVFPTFGVSVDTIVSVAPGIVMAELSSTQPRAVRFEMRTDSSAWQPASASAPIPEWACVIEFRSVDVAGVASRVARIRRESVALCS